MAGSNITTRFLLANNWQNELKQEKERHRQLEKGEKVIPKETHFAPFLCSPLKAKHQFNEPFTKRLQDIKPFREVPRYAK